jgi:hypothetical protein
MSSGECMKGVATPTQSGPLRKATAFPIWSATEPHPRFQRSENKGSERKFHEYTKMEMEIFIIIITNFT